MAFWKEFKTFAMKGNVMDMAVGVIIGGAFGKIVTSLVNDILMPPIGMLIGKVNFTDLSWTLKEAVVENGKEIPAVVWKYGAFIQQVIDFLIIAMSVFVMIKLINKLSTLRKKEEEEAAPEPEPTPEPEPEPTKEELLLTEIRDLLKQQQK